MKTHTKKAIFAIALLILTAGTVCLSPTLWNKFTSATNSAISNFWMGLLAMSWIVVIMNTVEFIKYVNSEKKDKK